MKSRVFCETIQQDVMQRKLFQKCTHLLYCNILSLGGHVNTRRMSKLDMGSIVHIKKSMKYSGRRKLLCKLSNLMRLTSSDTKRTLIYSCLQIPPKENWFQCVRRLYTTAINFPCITPWGCIKLFSNKIEIIFIYNVLPSPIICLEMAKTLQFHVRSL